MNPSIPHSPIDSHQKKFWFFLPFILTVAVIILDQLSKIYIYNTIPPLYTSENSIIKVIGDFLWIIHIANKGAMFSFGANFGQLLKGIVLFALPIILLIFLGIIIAYSSMQKSFRWIASGILGGGIGNMIDRLFRKEGVVDWISVKFYGLFGLERWPTFNLADSVIVVCVILWLIFTIVFERRYFIHKKKLKNLEVQESTE